MNDNIQALLRERAALRSLADQAIAARGRLGTGSPATAAFLSEVIDELVQRWALADHAARLSVLAHNTALSIALN